MVRRDDVVPGRAVPGALGHRAGGAAHAGGSLQPAGEAPGALGHRGRAVGSVARRDRRREAAAPHNAPTREGRFFLSAVRPEGGAVTARGPRRAWPSWSCGRGAVPRLIVARRALVDRRAAGRLASPAGLAEPALHAGIDHRLVKSSLLGAAAAVSAMRAVGRALAVLIRIVRVHRRRS
ncbi:MAG: hypothetical protein AVDCRST_MAG11-3391 [uncultured Gemmatimonadaceae bacterium]|uniref:Uncharacterized protein n=1 Tax=uncultured Gemmatimonadaceae bacterium TaxID=246130 RepID=A0A6J4M3B5_9BACT|nr:MAG: hypothetical protein AVDCRST_MAG11-3391 [uncultured Gemmatimonadaceae bacterium]